MQAGTLRDRVTFSVRELASDGYGNEQGDFEDQFTVAARIQSLRGGETVMADRLQGKQPVVMTVRASDETRQITTDWRAVDARDASRIFNVRSVTQGERRDYIDVLAESGVAV